jgi:glutathione synthase/RimK-type ligase-like ATP-grasp enzyme
VPLPVAVVTAAGFREIDRDLPLAEAALEAAGAAPTIEVWDDPAVDWRAYAGVVVRSTWDYTDRPEQFLAWAEAVEAVTRLANPSEVIRWSSSKRYLQELARAGIPVVPTAWLSDGESIPAQWHDVVVKPAVSAGGRWTGRYRGEGSGAEARSFADELLARGEDVLAQPYVSSVDERGEIGVYFFGGEPSHAIGKGAILRAGSPPVSDHQLAAGQSVVPLDLRSAPVEFASSVLDAVPRRDEVLYARIDCVIDEGGSPLVLEVEVVEPALFLETAPGSADRFAEAVVRWLR